MGVPVAAEHDAWIEPLLLPEELPDPRMAGDELPRVGPAVVGQVVAAAELDGAVDETPEVGRRLRDARGCVLDVKIEDDAGPSAAGPRQTRLVVLLDDPDGPVNHVDAVLPGIGAHRQHE